jgi:hypothetical protein
MRTATSDTGKEQMAGKFMRLRLGEGWTVGGGGGTGDASLYEFMLRDP